MKTIQFRTNIMCGACIDKVTPSLDSAVGADNWKVDITDPKKLLTVHTDDLSEGELIKLVESTGYKAETLA